MGTEAGQSHSGGVSRGHRPGISTMIYGGFFLLVVVIVAASLLGASALRRIDNTFHDVQRVQSASDLADEIERRAYALRLAVRDVVTIQRSPATARAVGDGLARLLREAAPQLSAEHRDMVDGMLERLARIETGLQPGGVALSAPSLDATTLDDEARLIARVAELMRKGATRDTVTLAEHFGDTIDTASRQSIAVGLICVLLGAGCALVVVRRTVVPLRKIVAAAGRVTAGATDVRTPFLDRKDEIGDMARATEALRHALDQVRIAQDSAQRASIEQRTVEAQYMQLFEQSADGIYQTTPDGHLLRANPALIRMMGYESLADMLDALGRAVESVYADPADHAKFRQRIDEQGAVRGFEYRARRSDGAIIWLSDSATVVRDERGNVIRYEGMLRDITDQKVAEAALAESQRRLREVIDTVPASINVKDRNLRFSIMNRYMATLLGIEPEDAIGRTTGELMARYNQAKSAEFDAEVLRTRKPLGYYEDEYADASGTLRHWLTTKIPILDENGEVDSIVTCALDIGERKRGEAALKAAKETAEAATEAKSQFLAHMSHEIRTPMNGVLGMIEILEHTDLDDAQRRLVGTVRSSATALLRIINDILDLSKLEADKLEIEDVPISLAQIISGVEDTLAAEARAKGLSWTVTVDPMIPPWLRGDPVRLRQVLLNLASNAVKFTERGGVHIIAERDDARQADGPGGRIGVRLIVQDTGIGMTDEAASRLFRPFEQTDASITRRFGGTGLGLSICRRIMTLMDGAITVESKPGQGSAFIVAVSLAIDDDTDQAAATKASAPAPDDVAWTRPKDGAWTQTGLILVADDHPVNRDVMLKQLEILGYAADAVRDGQEALEALSRTDYGLLLSDCHMPVLDGFELTARIRAEEATTGRHLPIVAITANALAGEAERCVAAGMDGYLSKPVQMADLRAVLARFLSREAETTEEVANRARDETAVLDLKAMRALFDDDIDAMRRTLLKFVDFAAGSLATLQESAKARDLGTLGKEAGKLSSAAERIGALALAEVSRALHAAAGQRDVLSIAGLMADVENAASRLDEAVLALGSQRETAVP